MKKSIIIFNRGTSAVSTFDILRTDPLELGRTTAPFQQFIVRDLWQHKVLDTMDGAGYRHSTSIPAHGTAHLLFTPYDPSGVDPEIAKASNSRLAAGIQGRSGAQGLEVYMPYRGHVSVFDVQGKRLASFTTTQGGQWYAVPCRAVVGGTYIAKASVQGRALAKTIVLSR
jgi:hypothetical protein